jgi:hypothetical protein
LDLRKKHTVRRFVFNIISRYKDDQIEEREREKGKTCNMRGEMGNYYKILVGKPESLKTISCVKSP